MEITSDVPKVVVRFVVDDAGTQFCDALYFTQDEYAAIGPKEIEAQQQDRYNGYLSAVATLALIPKNPPRLNLTAEEKKALLDVLVFQRSELDQQIAALE